MFQVERVWERWLHKGDLRLVPSSVHAYPNWLTATDRRGQPQRLLRERSFGSQLWISARGRTRNGTIYGEMGTLAWRGVRCESCDRLCAWMATSACVLDGLAGAAVEGVRFNITRGSPHRPEDARIINLFRAPREERKMLGRR